MFELSYHFCEFTILTTITQRIAAIVVSVSCLGGIAFAEDFKPVTGEVGAGYLSSSGNSDTTDLQASIKLQYQPTAESRWQHNFGAFAFTSSTDEQQTTERYAVDAKSAYNFSEFNYVFGTLNFEKDRFSGVDTRYAGTVGYGRRLLNGPVHVLNLELGAGARHSELPDESSETDAIVRGFLDYRWKLTDHSRFAQTFLAELGEENNFYVSDSSLHLDIMGGLSAKLGYVIKHNSDVPAGIEKTDRFTSVSVVYGF